MSSLREGIPVVYGGEEVKGNANQAWQRLQSIGTIQSSTPSVAP